MSTTSDYFVLRIRTMGDDRELKKKSNIDSYVSKQHWQRAQDFTDFQIKFFEKATGLDWDTWANEWVLSSFDKMKEYLEINFGICYRCHWSFEYLYIPIKNEELFHWCLDNLKNPVKVLKKAYYPVSKYA